MKPKLKGDLAALYAARATAIRKTSTFNGVEWIGRYTDYKTKETAYKICICGVNANGVQIAAYFHPGNDTAYFWQFADRTAVADIMTRPENAYKWRDVKNGIHV